ncbi:hypothetical protein GCM10029992_05580 [Glycomyces albus]
MHVLEAGASELADAVEDRGETVGRLTALLDEAGDRLDAGAGRRVGEADRAAALADRGEIGAGSAAMLMTCQWTVLPGDSLSAAPAETYIRRAVGFAATGRIDGVV